MPKPYTLHTLLVPILTLLLVIPGVIFLPEYQREIKAFGLLVWMLGWWIRGDVPLGVTALFPLIYLPLSGLLSLAETGKNYGNPVIFLFLGGFMLALAAQKHNVHVLLAQKIIAHIGRQKKQVMLGMLLTTAFLSMWISNTATAMIMLPVAVATVGKSADKGFQIALVLSIAIGANIGGLMTLVGTPPNLFLAAYVRQSMNYDLSFFSWFVIAFPIGVVLLLGSYWILRRLFKDSVREEVLGDASEELGDGQWKPVQKRVLIVFGITALAWMIRPLINMIPFLERMDDTIIALCGAFALFIVPIKAGTPEKLINWEDTRGLPWDILFLFGGGLSLAAGLEQGQIITHLSTILTTFTDWPLLLLIAVFCLAGILLTESMSNIALVAVLLPYVLGISAQSGIDFFDLAIPLTIAASCAFMLPISTPPNAIAYSSGVVSLQSMIRTGIKMNVLSWIVISLGYYGLRLLQISFF